MYNSGASREGPYRRSGHVGLDLRRVLQRLHGHNPAGASNKCEGHAHTATRSGVLATSEYLLLIAYACVLEGIVVAFSLFSVRDNEPDDLTLYNPVYMWSHTGNITFPMYLQYDYMTVHPPLHYIILGTLSSLHLPPEQTGALPLIILGVIIYCSSILGPFSWSSKLSIMTGFSLAAIVYSYSVTIRPELHILFAWFAAITMLESARLRYWNSKLIFVGSLLLAYASGLHYWALASALVFPVYAVWILV